MLKYSKTYKKGIGGSDKRDAKTDTIGANHEKNKTNCFIWSYLKLVYELS
ncbi:hypothetical protein AGMMS49921_02050 [Endomicrobiia bacterium]|nr:hypothetical protein AGMMS49921_02050 [Endomicrobiia bacterium]